MFNVVPISCSPALTPAQVAPWGLELTDEGRIGIRGGEEACLEPTKLDKTHHRPSNGVSARHKHVEQ